MQRRKISIPKSLLTVSSLGDNMKGRLKTTFNLIPDSNKFSSKNLDDKLMEIRSNFTKSLGNKEGRVILKQNKNIFEERINELKQDIKTHSEEMEKDLESTIDSSLTDIANYYLPIIQDNKPDKLIGSLSQNCNKEDIKNWIFTELKNHTPCISSLINNIKLEVKYKDVTYETLKKEVFMDEIKKNFPNFDW